MATVDIQEFQECASFLIDRARKGEAVTITEQGRPVALVIPAELPTRRKETIRPGDGTRYLPSPIKLSGSGPTAASYVSETRR